MNSASQNKGKEKSVPIAGVIFSCLFTIDVLFINFYEIIRVCGGFIQACGGIVLIFYEPIFLLLILLHIFPGIILVPTLLIIFIVQAVRFRKNRRYIRNCGISILCCFAAALTGSLISEFSPAIKRTIIDMKIQAYEATVDKIHSGENIRKYADMTGGTKGSEDVAFFQYSNGESERDDHTFYMQEYYVIYSEDSFCDVEEIKEHARQGNLYRHGVVEMQEIKENWYWVEVTYELG